MTFFGVGAVCIGLLVAPVSALVPLGLGSAYLASAGILRHRVSRYVASMRPAYAEANRGSFDLALSLCRTAMEKRRWPVSHLAALSLSYFMRRHGRFEEAIELCGAAAQSGERYLRDAIGTEIAVCYALQGKTGPAMTWLPPLRRHASPTASSYAIIHTRTGKTSRISRLRIKHKRNDEVFYRHETRVLAIMQAYDVFGLRGDYLSIRPLLMEAGPIYKGEFDYLGANWPKMQEFIETYVAPPGE